MAGETKRTYATKELDAESNQQEKGPAREQFNEKALKRSPEHCQNASLESQTVNNGAKFVEKERDNTQQREAVIRPQQAGKIDFKSLQNRSKFTSDRTWPSEKSSPQSPSGKSRNRDKGKKSGKGERGNPQQLYRLSITNPRSNPTIGIAYPQQKVSPPKKLETSRGPVSGSYRFHVPSIPEREAELQQEELNYNRCFQEGSSNLTSSSYTSQPVGSAAGPAHQHPPPTAQQQQPGQLETSNTPPVNQIIFPDFQGGADMWQSPDRTFSNASFGVSSQKPNNVVEVSKPNGFVPLSFQYGYPLLDDAASDPFPCDQNPQSQNFIEASLGPNQVPPNSFSFQSSGEEHEVVQSNTQFSNEPSEDRPPYSLHSKPPHYVQNPHGMPSSIHCTRTIVEDVSNSETLVSSSHLSEQNKSVLSDKSDTYCPVDTRDKGVTTGGKRSIHSKNGTSSQRVLIQGSVHHVRNIAQGQSSQMHFLNKAYSSSPPNAIHIGSAPHDKNASKSYNRVSQPWEGPNKTFQAPTDQNSTPYPFQCQTPLDQRQNTGLNSRMPWQQIHLTSAMPNQNRIELSRQLSNQQLTFLLAPSDWQEDSKSQKSNSQKNSNSFPSKRPSEAFSSLRQDTVKQSCSTVSPCQFTNKVESSQGQVTDAKNKSVYFAVNQTMHGSSSRTPTYPPVQVPTMGLMMVSPYDSPSHSPIQTPASSSTCSSLSPESTSPANSSSDDIQISKVPPPQFYHQQQGKASTDSLNSSQHHYHSEVSRSLHYNQERAKENIVSFSSNLRHSKPSMESGKSCMDSYGIEPHPPPPYSAHQLLASSLAAANLDQLDVLLTCKQCDQNFNNLASFLDHKQYCGQHTFAQNEFKDVRKVEDTRKFHTDHTKAISSGSSFAMSRSSSDLHLSLLGLNKNGEIMPDSEPKVEAKDDPMKLMLPSAPLPDLEMEDAKLDSLITEALNGLGYQSDNAEIDSSFIDAFVDDEITTTKCSSNRQTIKTKDSIVFESRSKHEFTSSEKASTQGKYSFDSDLDCLNSESKHSEIIHQENNCGSIAHKESTKEETSLVKRECTSEESSTHSEWVKEKRKSDKIEEESEHGSRFLLSRKFTERCGLKSLQSSTPLVKTIPQSPSATRSPTSQRPAVRDGKRKRTSGGSWSKELIHKIVQQKNKLHKLHVKGTKNMQFSLVMERVTPTVQNPTFREYDYVSDSDEDCEPVKIASQGRLSQSIRCKYTYTKECKGRIRAERNKESPWKQDKMESFESKKAEDVSPYSVKESSGHQRVRRRSSRSSTSSEISTSVSISSESISSPKSIDRTDSDCEKRMEIRKKDSDSFEQERSPQRILESSTSLALTFTKNTKHYSTDKILLSELKDSYTTSKCSNVISSSEETASEHTLTKSTVSLSRFKTTRVEVEEKMDHYGCEIGIAASTEEPAPLNKEYKDYIKASTHLRRSGVTLNPVKTKNGKETNHLCKIKRDNSDFSKGKSLHKKREDHKSHQDAESSTTAIVSIGDISSVKETKSDFFSEPPSLCSSHMDDNCVSPNKLNDTSQQKDRNCLMPYSLEHDQGLMKSPLSFDTSSMFGDLTGGFDNNLYPDIQLNKEGFGPIETTADKKELFESSFSPLLEQRDWGLIVDVTPELPDEIAQYKEDSDITNDKKTCFNHVPFTLPEKIIDYHPNLTSSVSEDELEIKRIVTELESQLQTAKLHSPSPLDSEAPKHLTMSKFSPLRLGHESETEQGSLDEVCPSESLALAAPPDSHPELFSDPDLPWSSPVQFGLMGGQQCLHTPTHSTAADTPVSLVQDKLNVKDVTDLKVVPTQTQPVVIIEEKTESNDSIGTATDKSEEMIEHEIYTESLMKSLEVMSDSLSSGLESSRSPLQENECTAKQQEKQNNDDKPEPTNETQRVEDGNLTVEFTKCSTELNKKLLEISHRFITHEICESNLDGTLVTKENTSVGKDNDIILQVKDTPLNELQPNTCISKNATAKDSEESSNTKTPVIMFEHKNCQQTFGIGLEPQLVKDLYSKNVSSNLNVPQTCQEELKEESTLCSKNECSQTEEIFIGSTITEDNTEVLDSVLEKHSTQNHENDIDKRETTKDNLENCQVIDSIESSYRGVVYSQQTDRNNVTTHEQPQINKEDQCESTIKKPNLYMTLSPAHLSCEEHVQKKKEDTKKLQPMCPSPHGSLDISAKCPSLHADKDSLTACWPDIGMITPALIEDTQNLKKKSTDDVDIDSSLDNCVLSTTITETISSFAPHLDLLETTENKMSSPGTILVVDTISKHAFNEASEKPELLDAPQNKGTMYEFKLSPLNYSERHFSDCSSETINEMDVQPNIKTSPKDSLSFSNCAGTFKTQLPTNCRLSPIHVQNELELTTQDHLVKPDIPHFQDTSSQNDKYSCVSPTHHLHGENTATANMDHLLKNSQGDLRDCHVPLETIDYMDLNINLVKKADSENADIQINPFKLDHLTQRHSMCSIQETLSSKKLPEVSTSLTNMPGPMMAQCTNQSDVKSSPKKSGAQNAVQGKFQCEICLMYFRTLPGLKRHKAMKHTAKTQSFETTLSRAKELKDDTVMLDSAVLLHPDRDGVPIRNGDQVALASVLEGTVNESHVSITLNNDDKTDKPPVMEKEVKNSKVKRSQSMEINNEGLIPDVMKQKTFSEELLSILKTDILQAISPDFSTMVLPECHKLTENQSTANKPSCHEIKATEEHQDMKSAPVHEKDGTIAEKCAVLEPLENNGQENPPICMEHTDTKEYLVKEISEPCEDPEVSIKCETIMDENDTHSESYKDQSLSPSGLGPDLKALFDDENTFSQLFPRNDEMKRKKCPRVYGKSNKKQKQMPSLMSDYTGPNMFLEKNEENLEKTDNVFVSNSNVNCEYETISLDDAKMLEMCHKSTTKSSAKNSLQIDTIAAHQTGCEDTPDVNVKNLLCQGEDAIRKPLMHLDGSEDTDSERTLFLDTQVDCKPEVPARSTPVQLACVQDNVSRHSSIDIPNLNTTFQLPEIQFFEPGRDISLVEDIASNKTEIKESEKAPKKPTERKSRKRTETGLKPKDKQYKCKVCFTWFLTLGELDFHKLSHNPSPPPTCYMCVQRKFSSREQLRDHLREKHAKNKAGVWTCGMCLKEISDVWMYNEHLREHATQFARKGQSQSSLLDMPGCFMQENAVKNFISSIMQHRSNKSMKGENARSSKGERKTFVDASGVEQKDVCESATGKSKGNAGGGSKHGTLEVLHKVDTAPKNVEMHPNCKDPSRDCHHCGKQFPKPFKLQRHLVVHSLQKIFMCHKCPVSYQEAKELKDHLKNEHEEVDELDSKHTTLYTCELCADVMHVIKKSFICSTCNYTFSKKEQFDRHMEKHLSGGNKIFKFRGVARPCKPGKSKDDEFDMPPNKRRKILSESSHENSLDSGIASIASIHLNQNSDTQGLKTIEEDLPCNSTDEQTTETNNTSVKIEDVPEDLFEVQEELGQGEPQMDSTEHTVPTEAMLKEEDNEDCHSHDVHTDTREIGTDNRSSPAKICNVKIEDECGAVQTTLPVPISDEKSILENNEKECSAVANSDEKMETADSDLCNSQISDQTNKSIKSQQTENPMSNKECQLEFLKQSTPSTQMNQQKQDQMNEQLYTERNENDQEASHVEQSTCITVKDKKSFENSKQFVDHSPRSGTLGSTDVATLNHAKITLSSTVGEDKHPIKQRKRKDQKMTQSFQRTASPATRENLGIDPKIKKKFRPNKCESVTGQRKADVCGEYTVLTSVKDDAASNKIVSKQKLGTLGLQPKTGPLDNFSPKKAELVRHLNGDCRGKRGVHGRPIHSPTSKMSVASMNNSFNKSRAKPGIKSAETHSYRTAESQNNLLSQLFGQRLTGFKIPLRKDSSESIN